MTGTDPRREGVLDLLAAHRPADATEAEHLSAVVAFAECEPRPFDRYGFSPGHLTASGFVMGSGGDVLLIHHRTIGAWLQPGGHMDPEDPDAASAAVREVGEETGVTGLRLEHPGLLDVDVHRHPGKPGREPAHLHFDLRFGFTTVRSALSASPEVGDARWVPAGDLAALGVGPSVLRPVHTLLDRLAEPGP